MEFSNFPLLYSLIANLQQIKQEIPHEIPMYVSRHEAFNIEVYSVLFCVMFFFMVIQQNLPKKICTIDNLLKKN